MKKRLNKFILNTFAVRFLQNRFGSLVLVLCLTLFFQVGCHSPSEYRHEADNAATEIIQKKMQIIVISR